jgi:hypothetical protein
MASSPESTVPLPSDCSSHEECPQEGTRVLLHSLVKATQYNGCLGTVQRLTVASKSGRVAVAVDEFECILKLKPQNLQSVESTSFLPVGSFVRIEGLQSAEGSNLNGTCGLVCRTPQKVEQFLLGVPTGGEEAGSSGSAKSEPRYGVYALAKATTVPSPSSSTKNAVVALKRANFELIDLSKADNDKEDGTLLYDALELLFHCIAHGDKFACLGDPQKPGQRLDPQVFLKARPRVFQGTPYFVNTYHKAEELQKICTFPRVCQKQRQDGYERTGQVAICTSTAAGLKWLMRRSGAKPFATAITAPYWDLGKKHAMWSFGFGGERRKIPPEVKQQFQLLGWVTRRAMDQDVLGEFLE